LLDVLGACKCGKVTERERESESERSSKYGCVCTRQEYVSC